MTAETRRIAALFRPYRRRLTAVLTLIVLSTALDVLSPFLLREVLDAAIPNGDKALLAWLVSGMIAIAIATNVLGVGQAWLSNAVGQRIMHDLRSDVYRHVQRLSLAFFTGTRVGEIQSRIGNDIGGVCDIVTSTATMIVYNLTAALASIAAMAVLDWRLAFVSLALLPLFLSLTRRIGDERKQVTSEKQRRLADMSSLVEETLSVSGVLLGKTMGRTRELVDRFTTVSLNLAELEVRSHMAGRWRMASVPMSFAILPALVYLFAGLQSTSGSQSISIGTLVAFTTLQTRVFFPIVSLLNVRIDIKASRALFERIFEYLDLPLEITESVSPVTLDPKRARGEVTFEDVSFCYEEHGVRTLDHVTFVVAPGTNTAIVGETGSGKTTLGYLVARLYDVTDGRVRIDGVDVRDMSFASLAETVGFVSQETFLFHASIADNLRFARPKASNADLVEAATAARIHDLIVSLPAGYDTLVGERGYRFSGGEKQRIAIARAILRNPVVLVLDEATSALDSETERIIQEALDNLAEGRTTIAIAHRISTMRHADEVIVLHQGRVVERGTHSRLRDAGGRYRTLLIAGDSSHGSTSSYDLPPIPVSEALLAKAAREHVDEGGGETQIHS